MENAKKVVAEFEGRLNAEIRRQEKLDRTEERDLRRELLGRYITKILYRWDDRQKEYLKKLERN